MGLAGPRIFGRVASASLTQPDSARVHPDQNEPPAPPAESARNPSRPPAWRIEVGDAGVKPVVVITGANGGLGRALVTTFSTQGWQVAAAGHRTPPTPADDNTFGCAVELADCESVKQLFAAVVGRFGRLDAVIHNAGITADGLLAHVSVTDWDTCLAVNLRGAFLCAQAAARHMTQPRGGHILQIGSFASRGAAGQTAYAAAKAGLIGLGESLARELAGQNVRVNTVWPGVLATDMTARLTPERRLALARDNLLGRWNELEEVARFIAHLAETRNISGQVFQLDSRISRWA